MQLNFLYSLRLDFEDVQTALAGFIDRHGKRFWRLRVTGAEIRIVIEDAEGNVQPIRAIIENVSGFVVKYEAYREVTTEKGAVILKSIGPQGALHLQPVNTPYPTKEWLQPKRYKAHVVGTTYVYDFPDLFRQAIRKQWKAVGKTAPAEPLVAKELVLDEFNKPQEVARPPGTNTIGMVGWIYTIYTPECPQGRRIVAIANDITFKIGSFGPAEDRYFFAVTELARELGLPRVYLSANSGARLGIAEELVDIISAAWNDPSRPEKGFKYLYLTPEKLGELKNKGEKSVVTKKIEDAGEVRYQITDIIGLQEGLGVESLRGSGLIAGETSRAYDDIFTITLVTARSVGIGAYLVRLGQRAVQVEGQPIILTGAGALNKVLGREVYSSNLQLGGTQIMYKNGVSHLTAANDLEGVLSIVKWLAYVPASKGAPLLIAPSTDLWDRPIDYTPIKGAYDPRWFLAGKTDEADGRWLSGFFDKGSFQETLSGWAQTVVSTASLLGNPLYVINSADPPSSLFSFRLSVALVLVESQWEQSLSKLARLSVLCLPTLPMRHRWSRRSWRPVRYVHFAASDGPGADSLCLFSALRFGTPTRPSRPVRPLPTSTVKACLSLSLPTGVDSQEDSRTCSTRFSSEDRSSSMVSRLTISPLSCTSYPMENFVVAHGSCLILLLTPMA